MTFPPIEENNPTPAGGEHDPAQTETLTMPANLAKPKKNKKGGCLFTTLLLTFGAMVLVLAVLGIAGYLGYSAGEADHQKRMATALYSELQNQYDLAVQDITANRVQLAEKRLLYIQGVDANYPGLAQLLAQTVPTAEFTPTPSPTPMPTPTPLAEGVTAEELFAQLQQSAEQANWDNVLELAGVLRLSHPDFSPEQVDGIVFRALRNRGVARIEAGQLEVGILDLKNAERLAPLDIDAVQRYNWARMYLFGRDFENFNWPLSIENYSTLYLVAPNFLDVAERLWQAYAKFGAALAGGGDVCGASTQYANALAIRSDVELESKRLEMENQCLLGTPTPEGALPSAEGNTPDPNLTPLPPP
jgi:tetratricopeptide (TPR) repeat protein